MTDIPFDVDQAGWGSRFTYPDGTKKPWKVDKWVLHYGGGANVAGGLDKAIEYAAARPDAGVKPMFPSVENEKFMLRRWQAYHVDSRGWTDIAYNYAVGQSGTIYRLRGENRSGATSGDYEPDGIKENNEARAVVWIGGAGQQPTAEAYASLSRLIQADPRLVIGHSDVKATSCPGDPIREWIKKRGWEAAVPAPNPEPAPPTSMFVRYGDEGPQVELWQDLLAYIAGKDVSVSARKYLPTMDPPLTVGVYDDNMVTHAKPYGSGGRGIGPGEATRILVATHHVR